jgi:hypothetical protein
MRPKRLALAAMAGIVIVIGLGLVIGSADSLNLASQRLTSYRTCTLTATPTTTTAVIDASVRQGSAASNFGAMTTNNVATGSAANRRLYIRFDLTVCSPLIAVAATIRLATLRLYLTAVPSSCRTLDLFRVAASWTETGITWNNQPFGTTVNNPASGTATATVSVGSPAGCQNQSTGTYLVGGNVTTDVAAYVAGSASNFGWMLRDDVEGSATPFTSTHSAKELGTVAQEPQLVITYVTVP